MVKILKRLFVLAAMLFAACCLTQPPPSGITNAPSPLPTKTQGTNQSGTVSSNVPSSGGTVHLPSIASLSIPDGFLQGSHLIVLSASSSPETAAAFDTVGELYNVSFRLPYEVRVNIGPTLPQTGQVMLTISLPANFLSAVPLGGSIVVFAQQDMSGGNEEIIGFDAIGSSLNRDGRTVTIQLGADAFTNVLTSDRSYEAAALVAAVPSPLSLAAIRRAKAAHGKPKAGKRSGPLTEGLGAPLIRQLEVRSPFGPRAKPKVGFHKGVDLKAKYVPVIAAADGNLEARMQRTSDPSGPMYRFGYGLYGIIRHFDGSTTVYAHLYKTPKNGPVKKGQQIATSGATGGADPSLGNGRGPHLHFEFIPSGPIPASVVPPGLVRVDPVPFIQILSVLEPNTPPPEIAVGGTLQLKAIDTVGHSMAVDSDGKPISLANLKWTSQDSGIVSVDDTGLVKGLSLGAVKITAHQTSSGRMADLTVQVTKTDLNGVWVGTFTYASDGSSVPARWTFTQIDNSVDATVVLGPYPNGTMAKYTGTRTGDTITLRPVDNDIILTLTLSGTSLSGTGVYGPDAGTTANQPVYSTDLHR